jgi:predicted membrane protein
MAIGGEAVTGTSAGRVRVGEVESVIGHLLTWTTGVGWVASMGIRATSARAHRHDRKP